MKDILKTLIITRELSDAALKEWCEVMRPFGTGGTGHRISLDPNATMVTGLDDPVRGKVLRAWTEYTGYKDSRCDSYFATFNYEVSLHD